MIKKSQYKVTFGSDTAEDYHLSISTRISRSCTANNLLCLNTISTIEAILIDRHFRALRHGNELINVDFITGGGNKIDFFLEYKSDAAANSALSSFSDYYKQIFNSEYEEDYFDERIYPLSKNKQIKAT